MFSQPRPIDISAQIILSWGAGGCPAQCGSSASPPALTHMLLGAPTPTCDKQNVSRYCAASPGGGTFEPSPAENHWLDCCGTLSFSRSHFLVWNIRCVCGKHSNRCLLVRKRLDSLLCSQVSTVWPEQTSHPRKLSFLFSETVRGVLQHSVRPQLGHLLRISQDSAHSRSSLSQDLTMLHDLLF